MNFMIKPFSCCLLSLLTLSTAQLVAEEENLLKNPLLEGDPIPYEWNLAPTGDLSPGEVAQDSDAGQEGESSLRITHPPGGGHYTQIRQSVSVVPRGKYILRGKVKTENLIRSTNGMPALFGMVDRTGGWLGVERIDTLGEWKEVEVPCEVPDSDTVQILIYLDAVEGSFWVEDVSLVAVEEEEAS